MFKSLKRVEDEVSEDNDDDSQDEVVDDGSDCVQDDNTSEEDEYKSLIKSLILMISEKGEGGVKDYLYSLGYEFDDVDTIVLDVHKAIKSGVKVDGKGMYCSGGVESIVDDDTEFIDDFEDIDEDDDESSKKSKKSGKKSEFDDPVEEVYSMLKEGDPIPIKLAEKLLGSRDNFDRLLTRDSVKCSKYQVFIESTDEVEEAAK